MQQRLIDIARVAATYTGTVIGAGFASGQELLQFFVSYGPIGLIGMILTGFLFALLGARILELGHRLRATSYHQVLRHVCGPRAGMALDALTALFLFGGLCIMLSGAGTVCRDYLGLSHFTGSVAMAVAVTVTVLFGVNGISFVNLFVIPLLLISTLSVSAYSIAYHGLPPYLLEIPARPELSPAPHWALACLLYVSYNIILGSTVLAPLGWQIKDKAARLWGGILGGVLLAILGLMIMTVIMLHYPEVTLYEVPMLYVSNAQHGLNHVGYAAMLIKAMFSTAMASLFGCTAKLQSATGLNYHVCLTLIALASLFGSQFGFADLVATLYPLFGYCALWFTIKLIWQLCRGRR